MIAAPEVRSENEFHIHVDRNSDQASLPVEGPRLREYWRRVERFAYTPDANPAVNSSDGEGNELKVIKFPSIKKLHSAGAEMMFAALQEWEGFVTSIDGDSFTAELIDKTNPSDDHREILTFDRDELDDDEKDRLRDGATLQFLVGIVMNKGTRINGYRIYFRR